MPVSECVFKGECVFKSVCECVFKSVCECMHVFWFVCTYTGSGSRWVSQWCTTKNLKKFPLPSKQQCYLSLDFDKASYLCSIVLLNIIVVQLLLWIESEVSSQCCSSLVFWVRLNYELWVPFMRTLNNIKLNHKKIYFLNLIVTTPEYLNYIINITIHSP